MTFQDCLKKGMGSGFNVVLTYGTFDCLHYGHIELLRRARELGDYLIVGLSVDLFNYEKGKVARFGYDERKEYIEQLRCVDYVFPEITWGQKLGDIKSYHANTLVMGDDWAGKFDDLPVEVVYLPRTEGVSSTLIRGKSVED